MVLVILAEATGLCLFVVINPCVLSANRVDLGVFCFLFQKFSKLIYSSPPTLRETWALLPGSRSDGLKTPYVSFKGKQVRGYVQYLSCFISVRFRLSVRLNPEYTKICSILYYCVSIL